MITAILESKDRKKAFRNPNCKGTETTTCPNRNIAQKQTKTEVLRKKRTAVTTNTPSKIRT
jgi:hypothetical protein